MADVAILPDGRTGPHRCKDVSVAPPNVVTKVRHLTQRDRMNRAIRPAWPCHAASMRSQPAETPASAASPERAAVTAINPDHLWRAVEANGLFVWDWDLVADRVERNGNYAALLGTDGGGLEPSPHAFLAHLHPRDRSRASAAIQHAISTAGSYRHQFRVVRSDGQLRRMLARGQVIVGPGGAAEHLVGIMLDVTDQLGPEQRMADMFEHSPEPFLSLDPQLMISYVNPAAEGIVGRSRAELAGRDVDVLAGTLGAQFRRRCLQVLGSGRAVQGESLAGSTGRRIQMHAYPDPQGVSVFLRDITDSPGANSPSALGPDRLPLGQRAARPAEVVAAPERLRAAGRLENAFADIAATVADARSLKWTLDTIAKVVVDATQLAACAIVLIEGEPLQVRVAGASGLPADYPQTHAAACRAGRPLPSVEAYRTGSPVLVADTRAYAALDGLADQTWSGLACFPLTARGSPVGAITLLYPAERVPDEAGLRFLHTVADQVAVAVNTARLSAEAAEAAVMQERQRLARELHDSVTQSLFSMTLLSRASQLKLQRTDADSGGELVANLAELEELSRSALAEMRALLYELRPQTLAGRSLTEALRAQADALQDRHGLLVEVCDDGWPQPDPCVEDELFRVSVEALGNIVRHASATRVQITLTSAAEGGVLAVRDDGIGFDTGVARPGHLGLQTMAERAERVGARLEVDSAPGRGTRVKVTLPPADGPDGQPA